jgi:PTH1 family peptidyl-tRNA hydrolase
VRWPQAALAGSRAGRDGVAAAQERWLIIGLGNPGPDYAANRHNAGFMVIDVLAARIGAGFRRDRRGLLAASGTLAGAAVILAKPTSYMNLSGRPIASLSGYYKIPAERLIIVHDELDLTFGTIRLKRGGGDSGHNGLRSVTAALGTREYHRVRVGIGRPPGRRDAADHVLGDFSKAERAELPLLIEQAADAVEALLRVGLAEAQNEVHRGN